MIKGKENSELKQEKLAAHCSKIENAIVCVYRYTIVDNWQ